MITHDIDLCIGLAKQENSLTVKSCDTGVNIRVALFVCRHGEFMDKHEAYIIPHGCTPVLKIAKPDKTYCIQDGTVQSGRLLFAAKPQAFTAAGTAQAEVSLFAEDGRRVTSATFEIIVPPECVCECETESGSYVDVMSEQIRAAIVAADRAEKAAVRAEQAGGGGTVDPAYVERLVDEYLEENPPAPGEKGEKGDPGERGPQGEPGKDGFSPTITVEGLDESSERSGYILHITDKNGTEKIAVYDGLEGAPGADGYTPQKGIDYCTEAEKAELAEEIRRIVTEGVKGKPYELIQSFTLTEDVKTLELNNFELDKFVLYITTPIYARDGGCRVNMYKGEKQVFTNWINGILDKDEVNTTGFYGRNESGLAFIEYAVGNNIGKNPTTIPKYIEGINPFTKIEFVMSAEVFPVDTNFELWGVRR